MAAAGDRGAAFATNPAWAARLIERALTAHVPFAWVAADGVGALETGLLRARTGYVPGRQLRPPRPVLSKPQAIRIA